VVNAEDRRVAEAVGEEREAIARAVELVVDAFRAGGRLVYVGAGTSGRLGVLDAAEMPPTFRTDPERVEGIIAGGYEALVRSREAPRLGTSSCGAFSGTRSTGRVTRGSPAPPRENPAEKPGRRIRPLEAEPLSEGLPIMVTTGTRSRDASRLRAALLRALALAAAPLLLGAADAAAQQGQGGMGTETRQLSQELQAVMQELEPISQQALQDTVIQNQLTRIQTVIEQGMEQVDPEVREKQERLNTLRQELQTAQQEQDTAKLRSLMTEGRGLEQEVQSAQRQVMQRDSVSEMLQEFQVVLQEKMVEIDPGADSLLEKRDSLQARLQEITAGGGGAGGS